MTNEANGKLQQLVAGSSVVNGGSLGAGEELLDYVAPFFLEAGPGAGEVDHRYTSKL